MRPPVCKPRIGQGRAGIRRRVRIVLPSQPKQTPAPITKSMPEVVAQEQMTAQTEHVSPAQTDFRQPIGPRIETRQVPFYPDPLLRQPQRLPSLKENRRDLTNLDMDLNSNFEENSPFQEGIILETCERLDRSYIKEPPQLRDLLNTTNHSAKILTKADRHRQDIRCDSKKSTERHTFANYN